MNILNCYNKEYKDNHDIMNEPIEQIDSKCFNKDYKVNEKEYMECPLCSGYFIIRDQDPCFCKNTTCPYFAFCVEE